MADFVAVLRKTLDGLHEVTPQVREQVYRKARTTIEAKLAAMDPPPPATVVERQKRALEDAINVIEKEYARKEKAPPTPFDDDPLAELENVFASMTNSPPRTPLGATMRR